MTFRELIEICDLVFPDRKQLEPVVDRVFDRYVSQIVNKVSQHWGLRKFLESWNFEKGRKS